MFQGCYWTSFDNSEKLLVLLLQSWKKSFHDLLVDKFHLSTSTNVGKRCKACQENCPTCSEFHPPTGSSCPCWPRGVGCHVPSGHLGMLSPTHRHQQLKQPGPNTCSWTIHPVIYPLAGVWVQWSCLHKANCSKLPKEFIYYLLNTFLLYSFTGITSYSFSDIYHPNKLCTPKILQVRFLPPK